MKKIMFNDKFGLTYAVLSGNKTQTRRVICKKHLQKLYDNHDLYETIVKSHDNDFIDNKINEILSPYSTYSIQETVAVAQTYNEALSPERYEGFGFSVTINNKEEFIEWEHPGCKNKLYVKADFMPHQIKITNVRVQRIQDISDDDCIKEGISYFGAGYYFIGDKIDGSEVSYISHSDGGYYKAYNTPKKAYAALIDKINGKGTWNSNPYVWVFDFELVK